MTWTKYLVLAALLLLLVTPVYAQFGFPNTGPTKDSQVILMRSSDSDTTLNISLLVFEPVISVSGDTERDKMKEFQELCVAEGATNILQCVYQKGIDHGALTRDYQINITSPAGAHFAVEYFNPLGGINANQWTIIPGCSDVVATIHGTGYRPDSTGDMQAYDYYYAQCDLTPISHTGKTYFRVSFIPRPGELISPSSDEDVLINSQATFSNEITAKIHDIVRGASLNNIVPGQTLPCLGFFLLIGLLLSSLYFAGKTPISLLDITTPRLPTPKGVTAGGQILAPFGYTEMKKTAKDKMASVIAPVLRTSAILAAAVANKSALNRLTNRITSQKGTRADRDAGDVDQGRKIASALVTGGLNVGMKESELAHLTTRLPYHYGDAEHKTVAEILQKLEAKGGRHTLFAMTLKDYINGLRAFQSLEVLTAHTDIGKRSTAHMWFTSKLGKFYGANRYAVLGPLIASSVDSTVRTGRIVGRMSKAMVTETPNLVRGVTKTTMGILGGKRVLSNLEARAKSSSSAAWVFGQLNKRPADIVVGAMFPINDKMAHLYRALNNEVLRDQMRYVLKQLYRKVGMKFDISHEELAQMGHIDINILKRSNFQASAELTAAEHEVRRILSNTAMTTNDKLHALMQLAQAHGAHIDHNMVAVTTQVEAIHASAEPEHFKMILLQEVLEQQNKVRMSATTGGRVHDDTYLCHVGGDSLNATHAWETMVLRTMIWDGEHGYLAGGIKEELVSARLNVANRLTSLDPTSAMDQLPEHMRNATQLKAVTERNRTDLISLFTEEGKKTYSEFATSDYGKSKKLPSDINSASIAHLVAFMYGGKMERSTEIDKKTGKMIWYSGGNMELSLPEKATLVDVKRHWVGALDSRENYALGQWVESRFTRGYVPAFKASIEAQLDRTPGSSNWTVEQRAHEAKKLWVADHLMRDMEQRFNSHFGNNTYGTTRETSRFYYGVLIGFMEKALQEKGFDNNHSDVQFLQKVDTTNPKHLDKLMQMMRAHQAEYDRVTNRDMTYDEVAKSEKAVVMLHEGGFAYYRKGMVLSDYDRILAGETTLRDNNGQKRRFSPDDTEMQFGARQDLEAAYAKIRGSKHAAEWEPVLAEINKWAKEGGYDYNRQKVLEAILWQGRNATHDYLLGQNYSELTVESRRNVAPAAPSFLRFFGVEAPEFSQKVWRPARDIVMHGLDYWSRIALISGGPVHTTSYDITAVSGAYRLHSMKLATQIMAGKFAADLSEEEKVLYRGVAMNNHAFFQCWQYGLDRNPWRSSSSFGTHQAWSSFFQFGPAVPYDMKHNLRAYMDRGTYSNFMSFYGFPMQAAKFMMRPYVNMFRGFQMSMQGYASKWDSTDDALRQWNYTNPRIMEALQSMNPFSATMASVLGFGSNKASKQMTKLNVFGGSLERHQLAGSDFQTGLMQSTPDIMLHRKGLYSTARTGDANPGETHYDYRSTLQFDPAMAEYLYRTKDSTFKYDQAVRDAAMDNTTRRTVSAEALNIRRRQELDMFGFERNSLWGFFNPLLFFWHLPAPVFPQSLTPRERVSKWISNSKTGQRTSFQENMTRLAQSTGNGVSRLLQPHRLAQVVYCPTCGMSSFRGSRCKNPTCKSYLY
ncbi:MAG: hypothetical protein ABID61_02205 [Candidatus Micrarchaeota archaeon]